MMDGPVGPDPPMSSAFMSDSFPSRARAGDQAGTGGASRRRSRSDERPDRVDSEPVESRAGDAPLAVVTRVFVSVVAVALQTHARSVILLGPFDVVEHGPHRARGVVARELDLGHVPVVA